MFLVNALRGLGHRSALRRKGAQRLAGRSRLARQLSVEQLEGRTLLSYTFTLIADNRSFLESFPFIASINREGTVAFTAPVRSGGSLVATGSGGPLNLIAITNDELSSIIGTPIINSAGTVASRGDLRAGGQLIFTGTGGPLTRVANSHDPWSPFRTLTGNWINEAGTVVFRADLTSGGQAIVTVDPGEAPHILYATGGLFSGFSLPSINNAGTVAVIADLNAGGREIFTGNGGEPTIIARTGDVYSGLPSLQARVPLINDAGMVPFVGDLVEGGQVLVVGNGSESHTVADTRGPFSLLVAGSINNSGTVVFTAELRAGGLGIFTGPDPDTDKILAPGDPLFGSTALGGIHGLLNDGGQLSFSAPLADGTRVLGRADPVAERAERVLQVASFLAGNTTSGPEFAPRLTTMTQEVYGLPGDKSTLADIRSRAVSQPAQPEDAAIPERQVSAVAVGPLSSAVPAPRGLAHRDVLDLAYPGFEAGTLGDVLTPELM